MTVAGTGPQDCWQILGIDCTGEERAIRRAYAAAIKRHRPDQDPEGFKRVRTAYEDALDEARLASPDDFEDADDDELEIAGETAPNDATGELTFTVDDTGALVAIDADGRRTGEEVPPEAIAAFEESDLPDVILLEKLVARMEEAFELAHRDQRGRAIEDILGELAQMSLKTRPVFDELLLEHLIHDADLSARPEGYWSELPLPVWRKMDRTFGWSENELSIIKEYGEEATEPLFARLDELRHRATAGSVPASVTGKPEPRRLGRSDAEMPDVKPKKSWWIRWLPYLVALYVIKFLIEVSS